MLKYFIILIPAILLMACDNEPKDGDAIDKSAAHEKLFELISPETSGVNFNNAIKDNVLVNILSYEYFYNGGGVATGDINNDGLPDIYFTGNQVENKLYLNKGDFIFEDITNKSGVGGKGGWSTGVTMADVNADGYLDIYVCQSGKYQPENRRNKLYINNGDLTFTERGAQYGLNDAGYSTQALFLDYDLDNDLDMYLLNHSIQLFTGQDALALTRQIDPYAGDKLFKNEQGKFVEVSAQAGIHRNPLGYGLGVTAGDINKDGWPDIYVTNDYVEPDYLYINQGDGTFSDQIKTATNHISNFGMGVDIADINNDTWPDIFVADMVAEDNYRQKTSMKPMAPEKFYQAVKYGFHYQYMFNTLQLNNRNTTFSEIGQLANISNTDWSWAALLSDFNNDGLRDLFVTNGFRKEFSNKDYVNYREKLISSVRDKDRTTRLNAMKSLLDSLPEFKIPNYIFENKGDLTFEKRVEKWGLDVPSHSNGASVADLDGDGDLDLVVNNIDSIAFIFRNNTVETIPDSHYLKIKFNGPEKNTSGIGARLYITTDKGDYYHEHYLTRGYQSSVEDVVHVGLGNQNKVNTIRIIWPDHKEQLIENVSADQTLTIAYKKAKEPKHKDKTATNNNNLIFADISQNANLDYIHKENDYNDFQKEILLPHKMSQFGPALAIGDANGDGLEDFYIGGAFGFAGALFLQEKNGRFSTGITQPWEIDKQTEDLGATFLDADLDGDQDLYVVSGGNEFESGSAELQDRLYFNDGAGKFTKSKDALPDLRESGSVVKPYDFDGDGDLDLFVGGRLVPGKYPLPANSRLLLNQNGKFKDVTSQFSPAFLELGLVTDAVWTDVNNNGQPDLVIVGEWMPVKIFEFEDDKVRDITQELGLEELTGWWYSIAASDLDRDGDMDLIAGNLGLNYKYKATTSEPFHVYYDDFDNNGSGDIVLGYFNHGELYPLRGKQCSSEQMPSIKQKFKSYHEFGQATLEEVYGEEQLDNSLHYTANTFASSVLVNNNGKFEVVQLPQMAQISSVNAIIPDDYDNDGITDLLIAGNLYPVEIETIRNDASIGLYLKGMGNLKFNPINTTQSGFYVPGDVKHMKKIKLADGSEAVLVAKNSDKIQLIKIHNKEAGKAGIASALE